MKVLPLELQTARYALTRNQPYISSLVLNLNFIEKKGLGTLGVDKWWRCYYDPDIIKVWSLKQLEGVLFHESNHLLRSHPERAESFEDKFRMNVAEDIEINPDVLDSGFELPPGCPLPRTFNLPEDLLAEEYYEKLPKNINSSPQSSDKNDKGKGNGSVGNGKCGSCAGHALEGEEKAPSPGDGISSAEQELIKRQVAKDIESSAKEAGAAPAGLQRWANQLLHPQVKWTKELASVVKRAMMEVMGKQDRTFKRISRLSGALDTKIILPGWKGYFPNVALIFDTSGSMGDTDLAKSIAEAKGVLRAIGGGGFGVVTISVDCAIGTKQRVNSASRISLSGGGGTDMGVGLAEAEKTKPRIDVAIVLTDGYTPWPSLAPPFKTIVVLTQEGAKDSVPSWAKTLMVN